VVSGIALAAALAAGTGMSFAAQNGGRHRVAAAAVPNPDCTLVVPPNPLSAAGLATPYQLSAADAAGGQCREADAATATFVQATIVDPATGRLSVYNPLVLDAGTRPAIAPVVPKLAAGSVVGIWFGFNGTNLTLKDSNGSLAAGKCVNGDATSVFGQFADCDGQPFFAAANAAIKARRLAVPALGTGSDGNPCPTTRDFTMVDQDQSDNVTSSYLIQGGTTAQNTAANRARLRNATIQVNGSDNLLLDAFIDKAVRCTPFEAPDLADNNTPTTSLALNELQAAADQKGTVALVPPNDPMTELNGNFRTSKLNLYRDGVDQAPVKHSGPLAAPYCQSLVDLQPARLQQDRLLTEKVTSPDPAAADNLFTFLAQRLNASFTNLGCQNLIKSGNPVTLQLKNGVAVGATFAKPAAAKPAPAPAPVSTVAAGTPGAAKPPKY
jgi:hypothetical protein